MSAHAEVGLLRICHSARASREVETPHEDARLMKFWKKSIYLRIDRSAESLAITGNSLRSSLE